jgi:WD40 repeat protein
MLIRLVVTIFSCAFLLSAMELPPSLTGLCLKKISDHELDSSLLSPHYKQLIKNGLVRQNGAALWTVAAAKDKLQDSSWAPNQEDLVAVSAEGRFIVIAYYDNTAKIWDLETGELLHSLAGHTDGITSVAIAPDDSYIVTGSRDTTAKLWDTRTGECLCTFSGHNNVVTSVAINSSQRQIVTSSLDGSAKIWNGYTGNLIYTLIDHTGPLSSVVMLDNDALIATKSKYETIKVWNAQTGQLMHTFSQESLMYLLANKDSEFIVTAGMGKDTKVWDAKSGEPISASFNDQEENVYSRALSNDNNFLVTGSFGTAQVWDIKTGKLMHTLDGHTSLINSIAISADDSFIVTGSCDGTVKVWSGKPGTLIRETGKLIKTIAVGSPVELVKLSMSNRGNFVITIGRDQQVKVWNLGKGTPTHTFKDNTFKMLKVGAKSSDGTFMARRLTSKLSSVGVYDTKTKELICVLDGLRVGHGDDVTAVAISPDNTFIVTGSKDKAAKVWDAKTGNLICTLYHQPLGHWGTISSILIDPSNTCITIGSPRFVYLWRITDFVKPLLDEKASPEDVLEVIRAYKSDSNNKGYCAIQ